MSSRKDRIRQSVELSYKAFESKMKIDNINSELVYTNQRETALEIVELFLDGVVLVTLLAEPQVGKTGVMLYTSYLMATHGDPDFMIDPTNIFIITGMDDTDWLEQTKGNFPDALNQKIYTRQKFCQLDTLDSVRDALIIIDECHIASEKTHQLSKAITKAGWDTPEKLIHKGIKIIQVSATPAHTLFNAVTRWGDNHGYLRMKSSDRYIGFQKLIEAGKIVDIRNIINYNDLFSNIEQVINTNFNTPKYHIFRLNAKTSGAFYEMITNNDWKCIQHNSKQREDVDNLLENPPLKHTFIVIQNFWRAGKRLNDTHIGVVFEPPSKKGDDNVTTQSLAGRLCGNDKQMPSSGSPIIYCDKKSIERYTEWFNSSDYSRFRTPYNSRQIRVDENLNISVRSSFHGDSQRIFTHPVICHLEFFRTINEVNMFLSEKLGKNINIRPFRIIDQYQLSSRLTTFYGGRHVSELTKDDRLTYEKYSSIGERTNLSSTGVGQQYMVYPVYDNLESSPLEVKYYIRYLNINI